MKRSNYKYLLVVSAVLTLGLAACGNNTDADSSSSTSSSQVADSNATSNDSDSSASSSSVAPVSDQKSFNSAFANPVLAYGGGLSDSQLSTVADDFKIDMTKANTVEYNWDNNENTDSTTADSTSDSSDSSDSSSVVDESGQTFTSMKLLGTDVDHYLNYTGSTTNSLFSSVYISKLDDQKAANQVTILTPSNITSITKVGYETPLLTAGVTGLKVKIASPIAVTGESALSGVYKALEQQGVKLDPTRTKVAQDEVAATSQIVSGIKTGDAQDKSKLDTQLAATLANMKVQLANGKTDPKDTDSITKVVDSSLKDSGLSADKIGDKNVTVLVNLGKIYLNHSDSVLDKDSVDKYKDFASDTVNTLKDKFDVQGATQAAQGFWAKIVNWFHETF